MIAQWSTGRRRMLVFDRPTEVGGECTRLTVSPSTLQFQLVAGKPSCAGRSDCTSKAGLYQRHHASSCSNNGKRRVENVWAIMTFPTHSDKAVDCIKDANITRVSNDS